jgi:hypothetical protein
VAIVVQPERELHPARALPALGAMGWLALAGASSMGAGAIHAAAIGVHSEHRQAVIAFTVVAVVQLAWGAAMLARPGRLLVALGAVAQVAILGGWALAKSSGISFVDGMEQAEGIQLADGLAAGLAITAVLAAAGSLAGLGTRSLAGSPLLTAGVAVCLGALAVPGMLSAGSHSHAGGAHSDGGHAHGAEAAAGDDHAGADHGEAVVPPKPFDPNLPIDLGGVEGVTLAEQAEAENLLAVTLYKLPQFSDPAAVGDLGFVSIGDGALGHEHYLNFANMNDDRILDPDHPESLVFDTSVTPKRLVAAMYMLNPGDTLDTVPDVGGRLVQWHIHDNLCFSGSRVAGLTDADGQCRDGLSKGTETPMVHVWIEPHPCGPFAALEGIAGGSVAEGEEVLCTHEHGS